MQMNKKYRLLLIFTLIFSITLAYSIFFSNPLFKFWARNTVERYIEQNYENCYIDGEIEYAVFTLFSPHVAVVKSYDNPDFSVYVYTDLTGLFIHQKAMEFFNE